MSTLPVLSPAVPPSCPDVYEDECPELPPSVEFDPDSLAWWAAQNRDGLTASDEARLDAQFLAMTLSPFEHWVATSQPAPDEEGGHR